MVTQYPYEIIEKKVENTDVELISVFHTHEFWKEWKDFYTKKIEQSPEGIVLEQVVGGEFWDDWDFFGQLGKIAYKNNIPVYNADPIIKESSFNLSLFFAIGGINLMSWGILGGIESEINLENISQILGGLSIISGAIWPDTIINKKVGLKNPYGQMDWRNIWIAEGIEKIIEKDKPKKLIAFHGALHTEPISFYLNHPKIREIKKAMYRPLNLEGKKEVRKYVPKYLTKLLKDYILQHHGDPISELQSWKFIERF